MRRKRKKRRSTWIRATFSPPQRGGGESQPFDPLEEPLWAPHLSGRRGTEARILLLLIGFSVLAVAFAFLWPAFAEFPMDDAYIHFVYARNLAEHGKLMFNAPGERGIGTSSPLWTLLLAGGHAAGIPLHLLAKALGIGALILTGFALYLLLCPLWGTVAALGGALLSVLSGPMVWFSLSGMETTLFWPWDCWRFWPIGLAAMPGWASCWGLTLTRPEGLALALAIAVMTLAPPPDLPPPAGLLALSSLPGHRVYLTGYLLPTSGISKHSPPPWGPEPSRSETRS